MDAGKRTISDIFNGSKVLEIPFFQRSYVWGEKQWERLLEDAEMVSTSLEPYFLGPIILKQRPTSSNSVHGDIRTVIDGQQRLTTLGILLKVFCLKSNNMEPFNRRLRLDDGQIVIRHNHNDIKAFNRIMDLQEEENIDSKDNVSQAYTYFRENMDPKKINFLAVTNSILLVGIDLSIDEDEQQIFDTINSIGVKLTTAELLKNYFFDRDDYEIYEEYWKNIFELDDETKEYWDTEITAGRYSRSFIDLFFYSYLQIKIQEKTLSVRTEDKNLFSKVDNLFDSYKKFIKDYFNGEKKVILGEIKEYALLFKNTFNLDIIDGELIPDAGIERINGIIFALETTTLIPYVLYIEKNVDDSNAKNELYSFIETFIMRRLICKATTKNYNQLFADRLILNKILSKGELIQFLDKQDDKINYLPSDDEMKKAFDNSILINKQAKGVIYYIESKIRDRTQHSTQLLGINKYSLEHIMPKKWRNHWGKLETQQHIDKRNRKLLTLGNLAIITQSLNRIIRDSDWETKKRGKGNRFGLGKYSKGLETFGDYLEREVWDEEAIQERADFLYEKAIEIWNLD